MDDLSGNFKFIMRQDWGHESDVTSGYYGSILDELPQTTEEIQQVYHPLVQKILLLMRKQPQPAPPNRGQSGALPFILGITGGVSVGKSSVANTLKQLLLAQGKGLSVEVLSTDGFLFPNQKLLELGIMHRKGFPESFDYSAIVNFLISIKASPENLTVPTYSHTTYDVTDEKRIIENPDILIIEGLNLLQSDPTAIGMEKPAIKDFLDLCIFLHADEQDIEDWYVSRFINLCDDAKQNKNSFFNRYSDLSEDKAAAEAKMIWNLINSPNFKENIAPLKNLADVILFKRKDHSIWKLALKED